MNLLKRLWWWLTKPKQEPQTIKEHWVEVYKGCPTDYPPVLQTNEKICRREGVKAYRKRIT
jgi:hypothetical protein